VRARIFFLHVPQLVFVSALLGCRLCLRFGFPRASSAPRPAGPTLHPSPVFPVAQGAASEAPLPAAKPRGRPAKVPPPAALRLPSSPDGESDDDRRAPPVPPGEGAPHRQRRRRRRSARGVAGGILPAAARVGWRLGSYQRSIAYLFHIHASPPEVCFTIDCNSCTRR